MDHEWFQLKEEAILFAKDKIEDAAEAVEEFLPDAAEELGWFSQQLSKELEEVRGQKLCLMDSRLYEGEVSA